MFASARSWFQGLYSGIFSTSLDMGNFAHSYSWNSRRSFQGDWKSRISPHSVPIEVARFQRKVGQMSLKLRLLTLVLLIGVAFFANLASSVSHADACTDGCMNEYQFCMGESNPPNQGACSARLQKCLCKCNPCPVGPGES